MKKLTIGIPTYNGAATIKVALDSIVNQIFDSNLPVDVVISNNASSDDTLEICRQYEMNYSFVKVYSNDENIEFDRNVHRLVCLSDSEYCWFFSDDEVLSDPFAIKKVLDFLSSNDVSFLYLNNRNIIKVNTDKDVFKDGEEFFCACKFKSGLITSNVVNVNDWKSCQLEKYFDMNWIHFAYQIEALSKYRSHNSAGIIFDYLFDSQPQVGKWGKNGTFLLTGIQLQEIFLNLESLGYSKNVKKYAAKVIKGAYPDNIIKARSQGLVITKQTKQRMDICYGNYLSYRLVDSFFLNCPLIICKMFLPYVFFHKCFDFLVRKIRETFND